VKLALDDIAELAVLLAPLLKSFSLPDEFPVRDDKIDMPETDGAPSLSLSLPVASYRVRFKRSPKSTITCSFSSLLAGLYSY